MENTSVRSRPFDSSPVARAIPQRMETFDEGKVSDFSCFVVYFTVSSSTFCLSRSHRQPFTYSERRVGLRDGIELIRLASPWCTVVSNHIDWEEIECRHVLHSSGKAKRTFSSCFSPYSLVI